MNKFFKRALEKIDKLDREQIKRLLFGLASENDLQEMVLNSMTDGLIVTNKEGRVLFNNPVALRYIPFRMADIFDQSIWNVVSDQQIAAFFNHVFLEQEKVVDREFTFENPRTIVAVTVMPLVKEKRISGMIIHIEDVTDKRTKEARLRRAENLAALTTLTAGVAHEIKNPLGSIGIHIQLIQKALNKYKKVSSEDISEYLKIIEEEVARLNKIVMDFLFAVRPINADLRPGDINLVIRDLLKFLKYELQEAHVELVVDLGELPEINLDNKFMKQALLNILQNALSAMPDGGKLGITSYFKQNQVYVEISDNGTGIPENQMEKIFEPYYTTKDFGSGLGLTLVFKIIKEHQGDITVNSRLGEGTVFQLMFPALQKDKVLLNFTGDAN
ncbi:MAG: PAS domain-containing protein [Spirochaetales bacterium]|nr:PAS domain-containing protein [Spirochaetales bacterium]